MSIFDYVSKNSLIIEGKNKEDEKPQRTLFDYMVGVRSDGTIIESKANETSGDDPTKDEMLNYLKSLPLYKDEDGFDDESQVAIYWFANHYHGGQNSNLYSVLSTSDYKPGPIGDLSKEGDLVNDLYNELVRKYFPCDLNDSKVKESKLNEEDAVDFEFKPGDVITDGLITGRVISTGTITKKKWPGYNVSVLVGREKGKTSFISREDATKTQVKESKLNEEDEIDPIEDRGRLTTTDDAPQPPKEDDTLENPEETIPEEQPIEEEPKEETTEIKKEYIGMSSNKENNYYMVQVDGDLQLVDQEGKKVFSAKEHNLSTTDTNEFIKKVIGEFKDMDYVTMDSIYKYIVPKEEPIEQPQENFNPEKEDVVEEEPKEEKEMKNENESKVNDKITKCKHCGAYINTAYGKDSPAEHTEHSGTYDDPKAPGDYDDICDVCNYKYNKRGGSNESKVNEQYAGKLVYTIKTDDIGKLVINLPNGKKISIGGTLGHVKKNDVGKQIYDVGNGVLQVENDNQYMKRTGKMKTYHSNRLGNVTIPEGKDNESIQVNDGDNTFNVDLSDDGSLDTVITINGKEFRFDQEFADMWRDETGELSDAGLEEMALDALANMEPDEYQELVNGGDDSFGDYDKEMNDKEPEITDKGHIYKPESSDEAKVNEVKQVAWKVIQNGEHVDTVFFDEEFDVIDVKNSLVRHDGYESNIEVKRDNNPRIRPNNESKVVHTEKYKGYIITIDEVKTKFGVLYKWDNNTGEPYTDNTAYKSQDAALKDAKEELDKYVKESKTNEDITKQEMDSGLTKWVADYLMCRKHGNIKDAKQIKADIDAKIKEKGLNSDDVYFYFGNPDDPAQKDEVYNKAEKVSIFKKTETKPVEESYDENMQKQLRVVDMILR